MQMCAMDNVEINNELTVRTKNIDGLPVQIARPGVVYHLLIVNACRNLYYIDIYAHCVMNY